MAVTYKPPRLFDPEDAPAVSDFVDGLHEESGDWRNRLEFWESLYQNTHTIDWPKNLPVTPTNVYTGLAKQQTRLMLGMMLNSETPQASLQSPIRNESKWKTIESLEAAGNLLWGRLEQQAREVWAPTTEAKLRFGLGWMFFSDAPRILATLPKRDATTADGKPRFKSDKAYLDGRQAAVRSWGQPGGRLPYSWRHVPTQDVLWRESDDGLDVVIERRHVYATEVLRNPLFAQDDRLKKLRGLMTELTQKGARGISRATVEMTQIETPESVTLLCGRGVGFDATDITEGQIDLWAQYQTTELAYSGPNPVGRIRYVPDHGLIASSRSQWNRYRAIYDDMADLIVKLDTLKSWIVFDHQMHVFAPIVLQPLEGPNPNQPAFPLAKDAKQPTLTINVGYHTVSVPPPGYQFSYLTKPSNPEYLALMADIRRDAMLLGIPETILDTAGVSSGYMLESLLNTAMAAGKTVIQGTRLAWQQLTMLLHDTVRMQGETIEMTQVTDQKGSRWVALDPKVLQDESLNITIDVIYEIKRPQNDAAALQNYEVAVNSGALDERNARETYLQRTDHEAIAAQKLIDGVQKSQPWLEWLTNEAIREAGMLAQEEAAKQQAALDLQSLLAMTPSAADLLAQEAPAGAPGYGPAQEYLALRQQAGQNALGPGSANGAQPQPDGAPQQPRNGVQPMPGIGGPGALPGTQPPTPAGAGGAPGMAPGQRGGLPGGPRGAGGLNP